MGLEVVLDEHAELRITQRMGIDKTRVVKLLRLGLYSEITTVKGLFTHKYIVVWDSKKQKPFLLILRLRDEIWRLVTTYETYAGHGRRDWVIIRYAHILEAKMKLDGFAQAIKLRENETAQKTIKVQLLVIYELEGRVLARRCSLGRVLVHEYESRYKNNHRLLLRELLEHGKKVSIEVPSDAMVYYELIRVSDGKKETFVSKRLC